MNPNADNIATQRYPEYLRMRREEQIANIALMSRFRYSRFYEPGKNTAIDTYFANRRKTLALSSSARRAGQIKNLELMYRASRLNGKGLAAMKYSFKNGAANALTFGSMAGSLKGFWISIRSGFISVISGIAKGSSMGTLQNLEETKRRPSEEHCQFKGDKETSCQFYEWLQKQCSFSRKWR